MRRSLPVLISCLIIAISCSEEPVLNTFGSISGVVMDARANAPLGGVRVSLTPTGSSQVTGQDGAYLFDNLQVQEYTIVFSKEGYRSDQQKVSVKPGITSSAHASLVPMAGSFTVDPSELDFGSTQSSMKIQVRNASGTATNFSASTSNSWLSVTPETGTITQSDYLTVVVSREGLSPGDYAGDVTIRYAGETLAIPVKMSIMSHSAAMVTIENVSEVGSNSAKVHGALLSIGASSVSKMGFCYSSSNTIPTTSDSVTNQGDAFSPCSFSAILMNLTPETTYYCRAFAQNAAGIAYSEQCLSFTTTTASESGGGGGGDTPTVAQGLMLYFTFDDGEVKDLTDNEIEAVTIGSPSFLTDTPNGAGMSLFLNGLKGQYISIPYALFDGLNNYSISFWAKDFGGGSFVSGMSVLGISYAAYNRPKVYLNTDGKLVFDTYGRAVNDASFVTPAFSYPFTSLQSGEWHHICVTLDIVGYRDAHKYLYVDGSFVDTLNDDVCDKQTNKILIGGDAEGGYSVPLTSKIDNVRFYNRTLSKEEVKAIFNSEH